jgi:large subunit ribosomal protein L6
VPKGVTVTVQPEVVEVKGPKGTLKQRVPPGVKFRVDGAELLAETVRQDPDLSKYHGLARSLMANAVQGVTDGFKKELDIVGVGYRAEVKGKQVHFALGYSHPVVFDIPPGIDVAVDKQTHITVTGVDRQAKKIRTVGGNVQQAVTERTLNINKNDFLSAGPDEQDVHVAIFIEINELNAR